MGLLRKPGPGHIATVHPQPWFEPSASAAPIRQSGCAAAIFRSSVIAIYSLNISSVGRSTHAAGTAGAHIRYITRPGAEPIILAARMPSDRHAARSWINAQESADRKNARVIDRIIIALPRELDTPGRINLTRRFCEQITQGRASWFAAIHQAGCDAGNPHAHVIIRDRDITTGKRVAKLSDKGSAERVRLLWQRCCNAALKAAGSTERVDRRSHAARGITAPPQRHRGPVRPPVAPPAAQIVQPVVVADSANPVPPLRKIWDRALQIWTTVRQNKTTLRAVTPAYD